MVIKNNYAKLLAFLGFLSLVGAMFAMGCDDAPEMQPCAVDSDCLANYRCVVEVGQCVPLDPCASGVFMLGDEDLSKDNAREVINTEARSENTIVYYVGVKNKALLEGISFVSAKAENEQYVNSKVQKALSSDEQKPHQVMRVVHTTDLSIEGDFYNDETKNKTRNPSDALGLFVEARLKLDQDAQDCAAMIYLWTSTNSLAQFCFGGGYISLKDNVKKWDLGIDMTEFHVYRLQYVPSMSSDAGASRGSYEIWVDGVKTEINVLPGEMAVPRDTPDGAPVFGISMPGQGITYWDYLRWGCEPAGGACLPAYETCATNRELRENLLGACKVGHAPMEELCNYYDDDCDGMLDEDYKSGGTHSYRYKDNIDDENVPYAERYLGEACTIGVCDRARVVCDPHDATQLMCAVTYDGKRLMADAIDPNGSAYDAFLAEAYQNVLTAEFAQKASSVYELATEDPSEAEILAYEPCDGKDNNCDGRIDEPYRRNLYQKKFWYKKKVKNVSGQVEDVMLSLNAEGCGMGACEKAQNNFVECDPDTKLPICSAVKDAQKEICGNYVDDDCDGDTDEGFDIDGDGYQSCTCAQGQCALCSASVAGDACIKNDCNDYNNSVNPGVSLTCKDKDGKNYPCEVCDNVDNDCDGEIDTGCDLDGDGFFQTAHCNNYYWAGPPKNGLPAQCELKDGPFVPGEACCRDEAVEEALKGTTKYKDLHDYCTQVYAKQDPSIATSDCCLRFTSAMCEEAVKKQPNEVIEYIPADCNDEMNSVHAGAHEECNRIDDDCDGVIDEDYDVDQDGFYACCFGGIDETCSDFDCDDSDKTIHPGAEEICDGKDNDCRWGVDNLFVKTFQNREDVFPGTNVKKFGWPVDQEGKNVIGGFIDGKYMAPDDEDLKKLVYTNIDHCGGCNKKCEQWHAIASCGEGVCKVESCLPGYADLEKDIDNGCETSLSCNSIEIENSDNIGKPCEKPVVLHSKYKEYEDILSNFDQSDEQVQQVKADIEGIKQRFIDGEKRCGCIGQFLCSTDERGAPVVKCVVNSEDELDVVSLAQCAQLGSHYEEICDQIDNDCDGEVDEGFVDESGEYTVDPHNCGGCGLDCANVVLNAAPICNQGGCSYEKCNDGYIDRDHDRSNGCDYPCVPTPGDEDDSSCNEYDDNCDGNVDEGVGGGKGILGDPLNCGKCGHECYHPEGGIVACEQGVCKLNCDNHHKLMLISQVLADHQNDEDYDDFKQQFDNVESEYTCISLMTNRHCGDYETSCFNGSKCQRYADGKYKCGCGAFQCASTEQCVEKNNTYQCVECNQKEDCNDKDNERYFCYQNKCHQCHPSPTDAELLDLGKDYGCRPDSDKPACKMGENGYYECQACQNDLDCRLPNATEEQLEENSVVGQLYNTCQTDDSDVQNFGRCIACKTVDNTIMGCPTEFPICMNTVEGIRCEKCSATDSTRACPNEMHCTANGQCVNCSPETHYPCMNPNPICPSSTSESACTVCRQNSECRVRARANHGDHSENDIHCRNAADYSIEGHRQNPEAVCFAGNCQDCSPLSKNSCDYRHQDYVAQIQYACPSLRTDGQFQWYQCDIECENNCGNGEITKECCKWPQNKGGKPYIIDRDRYYYCASKENLLKEVGINLNIINQYVISPDTDYVCYPENVKNCGGEGIACGESTQCINHRCVCGTREEDEECGGLKPYCLKTQNETGDSYKCVNCLSTTDCPHGLACVENQCVGCQYAESGSVDSQQICDSGGKAPICDEDMLVCRGCYSDEECSERGFGGYCNVTTGECLKCDRDSGIGCSGATPICYMNGNALECRACENSDECDHHTVDGQGLVCDTEGTGECVHCSKHLDCAGHPNGEACVTLRATCSENDGSISCNGNTPSCTKGDVICINGETPACVDGVPVCNHHFCHACSDLYPCNNNEFCVNGQCVTCRSDSDCSGGQYCNAGQCSACTDDAQCAMHPKGHYCYRNECASCNESNGGCGGNTPICDNGTCRACDTSHNCSGNTFCHEGNCLTCEQTQAKDGETHLAHHAGCSAQTPICEISEVPASSGVYAAHCHSCKTQSDCAELEGFSYCYNGQCMACDPNTGAGCDPNSKTPYCQLNGYAATCTACTSSEHCPADKPYCENGYCQECLISTNEGCPKMKSGLIALQNNQICKKDSGTARNHCEPCDSGDDCVSDCGTAFCAKADFELKCGAGACENDVTSTFSCNNVGEVEVSCGGGSKVTCKAAGYQLACSEAGGEVQQSDTSSPSSCDNNGLLTLVNGTSCMKDDVTKGNVICKQTYEAYCGDTKVNLPGVACDDNGALFVTGKSCNYRAVSKPFTLDCGNSACTAEDEASFTCGDDGKLKVACVGSTDQKVSCKEEYHLACSSEEGTLTAGESTCSAQGKLILNGGKCSQGEVICKLSYNAVCAEGSPAGATCSETGEVEVAGKTCKPHYASSVIGNCVACDVNSDKGCSYETPICSDKGTCLPCTTNAECLNAWNHGKKNGGIAKGAICVAGHCEECGESYDCNGTNVTGNKAGLVCSAKHKCEGCASNDECYGNLYGQQCNADEKCSECNSSTHAGCDTNSGMPQCTSDGVCGPCQDDAFCRQFSSAGNYCNTGACQSCRENSENSIDDGCDAVNSVCANGVCRRCQDNSECPNDNHYCYTLSGDVGNACHKCQRVTTSDGEGTVTVTHQGCGGTAPECSEQLGICVCTLNGGIDSCANNSDNKTHCNGVTCVQCTTSAHCASNETCTDGVCNK